MKQIVYVVVAGTYMKVIKVFTTLEAAKNWLFERFANDGFIREVVVDEHYYD